MDIWLGAVMFMLGLFGSFFSGLLGIGGAIINYPLLLFVPSSLGLAYFTAQEVSTISMFQVFFASLAGILAYRRKPETAALVHKGLVTYMGASILVGSMIGGFTSRYLLDSTINLVYGILAIIAVVLMLIPNKGKPHVPGEPIQFHKGIAAVSAFLVGCVSGIVGAGGAFILIPIMLTLLKIPTRVTIASSLAIVFISAIGGVIGKLTTGHLLLLPILFTVIGSMLGAPIGSRVSGRMNVKLLRYLLVVIILATAIKIWLPILFG